MSDLLSVVLPVFLVIGIGYGARWRGLVSDADTATLMRFTQGIAIPILLFRAISQLDLGASFNFPLLGSFYTGALAGFACGMIGARLLGRAWEDSVAVGFCCLFSNSLLLGLPITERAFGTDALVANYAIIAVHSPICYLVGITAMELVRARGRSLAHVPGQVLRAMFHNPLIIGISIGMVVNLSGLRLPVPVGDGLDLLARAGLPAALFGLGAVIRQYRPEGDFRIIALICATGLILHPLVTYGFAQAAQLPQAHLRSAVVTAAMAPGVNAYIFANMYGVARRVAASGVLIGSAASILTVTIWLHILP